MANKYAWSITKMVAHTQDQGFENVVYSVDWEQTASTEDAAVSVSLRGTQLIPLSGGAGFIPAEQLTQDTAVGWVKSAMGNMVLQSTQDQLDALIQEKLQPQSVEITLPWMAS
jgi:hypothetical protein